MVTLDVSQLIFSAITGLVGLTVFMIKANMATQLALLSSTFNTDIQKLKAECAGNIKSLEDRLSRTDEGMKSISSHFERVEDLLKNIQLQLANHYPTKSDLQDAISDKHHKLEHVDAAINDLSYQLSAVLGAQATDLKMRPPYHRASSRKRRPRDTA